jgi:hypothetical protein
MTNDKKVESPSRLDRTKLLGFRSVAAPSRSEIDAREISDLAFTKRGEPQPAAE